MVVFHADSLLVFDEVIVARESHPTFLTGITALDTRRDRGFNGSRVILIHLNRIDPY